jgi:signal transduction histidine kinase
VGDYRAYPAIIPAFAAAGLISVVAVPIVSGDRVFGALSLVSTDKPNYFSDSDVAILTSIGRQAGIAIENARLYDRMRFYARQITQAQEDERERIAREMHDETIQTLIVISRRLEALGVLSEQLPKAAEEQLASLQELIASATRGMRRFIRDLRPSTLDHLGFVAAVKGLASELADENAIDVGVKVTGETQRLTPEEELVLFRITQEALSNVRRHSGATQATVYVEFRPHHARVTICDDGHGFDAPARIDDLVPAGKLGLIGMQERARTLGGTLVVRSAPEEGTTVIVDVPLHLHCEADGG